MSEQDVIANALDLPSGARFAKCALQVNPHHYSGTFRGQDSKDSPAEYARAMVDKAAELGVSVLAITDHNSVRDVSAFQDAAANYDITIFPGFELASTEGVHVLCLYSPDTDEKLLNRFLGEFGVHNTEPSAELCDKSFAEVLDLVREQGGVTIAAHVTSDKGLLKELFGLTRIKAWQNENLLAIQIPGSIKDLPEGDRKIVEDKNVDYRRDHKAGERQAVAVLNAKDVCTPEDLEDPSATCWLKMSADVSVDGLRQAFLDPDSRIRLNNVAEPEEHSELVALAWEGGGFLDGAAIHFNPNLNVLVGGRGTGKSTVVESLRYVLGLDPVGEDARKAHEGIVRKVLRNGTKISLLVRSHHPAMREYRIERTVPNPPQVRDESQNRLKLLPRDVMARVEVYGQHEISELTNSPEKPVSLLRRFIQPDESLTRRKADVQRELEKTRKVILDTLAELDGIEERLAVLPSLEETLERFREAGFEDRLREQSLLVREERVLDSIPDRVQVFRESLQALRQELPIDLAFLSDRALKELPGRNILTDANDVLERLSRDLEEAADLIESSLKRADEGIGEIGGRWAERKHEVETAYEEILRDLQKSAVDGGEFIRLRREIESLRPLSERRSLLERLLGEQRERRSALHAEWEDLKASAFRELDRAVKNVNSELKNRVEVEVVMAGNREPLSELLRQETKGRFSETIQALEQEPDLSLSELVDLCRAGARELHKRYTIPLGQAETLAKVPDDALMRIEELELPPTTTFKLNVAPPDEPPSWRPLDELSKGQKATAVLLLLLLESDAPLIIDQPEDDLDNRFIAEGVLPRIRDAKRRRQFVFSTHNANIPVLGDAELILGLDASGEAEKGRALIKPEHMSSIDSEPVRELVESILEGGQTAFETRRRKYGF